MATLPAHFGIGLKSAQPELPWMVDSGVPWDYRYQYINPGWINWNSPPGQVAANYVAQSISNHYVPVFTWYEIGGNWMGSVSAWWSYLNTLSSMNQYFADFALLMGKIASASSGATPVIVQVEPDLWGFMQQNYGDDPTIIPVSVASSGFAALGGLANNAAGFAQALIAIRDAYAPNVIMAWHASQWGPNNGYDPTLTNPAGYQTPQVTGGRVAAFYAGLHASYDMIFHDPSDADAAYKTIVRGEPAATAWWTTAAFASYLQYIGAVYQATGLNSMLWQVPVGNTLYLSCNNTPYHYQDNRAQYFLASGNIANVVAYGAQGVIGLLFGNGQNTTTDYLDNAGDGITNPPAIGSNTLVASYPDDDGGFLRTAAAAYYAAGPMPTSGTFAAGETVVATTKLNVYKRPTFSSRFITEPAGTSGTLANGPVIAGGYTWWYAAFPGHSGWVLQNNIAVR
jgi:hypothetical protein